MSDEEHFGDDASEIFEIEDALEEIHPENEEATGEGGENQVESGEGEDNTKKQKVKPKRVLNPRPKLNAEVLRGNRGLRALESYFDRVKFKGRDYEEQDLAVILKTYEYWCHRLFPKYPFDDCIAKIEHLGSKKGAVKTFIKKMRLNMVLDEEPTVNLNDNDSETDEIPVDAFDDLMGEARREPEPPIELTEEQLQRIQLNKERAEKIRREKLKQKELTRMESQEIPSSSGYQNLESLLDENINQEESTDISHNNIERGEKMDSISATACSQETNDSEILESQSTPVFHDQENSSDHD